MKQCNRCLKTKSLESFFKDKSHSSGRYSICKECKKLATYEWRSENRGKYNQVAKDWRKKNHFRNLGYFFATKYRLKVSEYQAMVEKQNGLCWICNKPPIGKKRLSVDHCHTTKKVRGLLCDNCNKGIGNLKEDPKILVRAIRYLEEHKTSHIRGDDQGSK